jgi:hypothetical protein
MKGNGMSMKLQTASDVLAEQEKATALSGSAEHKKVIDSAWTTLRQMQAVKANQENKKFQELKRLVTTAIEQAEALPASHAHLLPGLHKQIGALITEMRKLVGAPASKVSQAKSNRVELTPGEQRLASQIRAEDSARRVELQKQRSECLINIAANTDDPDTREMFEEQLEAINGEVADLSK